MRSVPINVCCTRLWALQKLLNWSRCHLWRGGTGATHMGPRNRGAPDHPTKGRGTWEGTCLTPLWQWTRPVFVHCQPDTINIIQQGSHAAVMRAVTTVIVATCHYHCHHRYCLMKEFFSFFTMSDWLWVFFICSWMKAWEQRPLMLQYQAWYCRFGY